MNDTAHSPSLKRSRIALVAYSSLGDGLLYLMMAENLRLNGYNVTYFGDLAFQMRAWMPQLTIQPYPEPEAFDSAFDGYDLVIMSPPQFVRDRMDEQTATAMREKWMLICQKPPANWYFDHTERVRQTCDPGVFEELRGLLQASGSIRFRKFTSESMIDIMLDFMRHRMGLSRLARGVELTPPASLAYRRYPERIVVSPDSARPKKKNWPPKSFLALCHELRARGYDPKIVVAPRNHPEWSAMPGNVFDTPVFPDIGQLSAYLYESGAVIANDSGNGHLASFLGIPVVTIYRKRNPAFHWRPSWGPAEVICPRLTIPWFDGPIWGPFVSTSDIIDALARLR
ncbi:glycosyltransferase family 9 protein [Propionivibrio soli]|uniref:glycosyltransferase family 9 protein n=1 Tax=Propionivibrio soli TaxID=2976531 RepID=UPI0021E7836E|nr:glycosyltransferase family 9 protein [Propionivibrio soli]